MRAAADTRTHGTNVLFNIILARRRQINDESSLATNAVVNCHRDAENG